MQGETLVANSVRCSRRWERSVLGRFVRGVGKRLFMLDFQGVFESNACSVSSSVAPAASAVLSI